MTSSTSAVLAKSSLSQISLLIGILLIAANLRSPITSLGPVLSELQRAFGLSQASAGFLNALPLLIFAAASPFASSMSRRFGLERALFAALWLIAAGCLLRSSGGLSGLWLGTSLLAVGIAMANVLVVPLVKRDFPNHTALCVGLYAATMALMAAIASGVAVPLSAMTTLNWRLSLGIWAIFALVAALIWWPHSKRAETSDDGQQSDAQKLPSLWKSATAWQVSMFMALQTLVFYTLIDWFPAMVTSAGIGASDAGVCLFAYQVIAVAANLATSYAIKGMRDQRLLGFLCSLAIAIGLLGLLIEPRLALLWLLFAGVGAGMSMVTCLTLFGLRSRNHHQASALSGMAQCIGYGLGAIGPFLAGWLRDVSGGWQVPLTVLLVAAVVQMVFAVLAGRKRLV